MYASGKTMPRRRRALIIADDHEFRRDVVGMMPPSFDIAQAANTPEAVAHVEAATFDVILMDLDMPRMNGQVTLSRLQQIAPGLARRVLFMTGGSDLLQDRIWVESFGPNRLLLSPFSRERLAEAIDALLVE
jgi:CheY-like chemotaxis protein